MNRAFAIAPTEEALTARVQSHTSKDATYRQRLYVLIVNEELVSFCGVKGAAEDGIAYSPPSAVRIGVVWTHREWRGHGFASFVVAHACRAFLGRPEIKQLQLFADTANPTSNKIYRKLGFKLSCGVGRGDGAFLNSHTTPENMSLIF